MSALKDKEREQNMKATVFPNLILEVISHHSCCILLVTLTDRVQCGRRLPKGMNAEGGAHWGPSGRLVTIGELFPNLAGDQSHFTNAHTGVSPQ